MPNDSVNFLKNELLSYCSVVHVIRLSILIITKLVQLHEYVRIMEVFAYFAAIF